VLRRLTSVRLLWARATESTGASSGTASSARATWTSFAPAAGDALFPLAFCCTQPDTCIFASCQRLVSAPRVSAPCQRSVSALRVSARVRARVRALWQAACQALWQGWLCQGFVAGRQFAMEAWLCWLYPTKGVLPSHHMAPPRSLSLTSSRDRFALALGDLEKARRGKKADAGKP
jgi:hypothetical protein